MSVQKCSLLFTFIGLYALGGYCQSGIELIPTAGTSFADEITYQRCTGHIDPAFVFSLSFIYHPSSTIGLELSYLNENPFTYLSVPGNPGVQVYTESKISVQRLLGGLNFSFTLNKFRPYFGCLLGFTYVNTANQVNTGEYTSLPGRCKQAPIIISLRLLVFGLESHLSKPPMSLITQLILMLEKTVKAFQLLLSATRLLPMSVRSIWD